MRGILQIKEENGCRRSDTDETLPLPPGALLASRVAKKTVPAIGLGLLPQAIRCFAEHRLRLPFRYLKHTSKLIRKLGNSDLALHHNKVVNLKLAVASIDGVVIGPGEYFSFCRLVGRPTRKRGYVEGMAVSFGEARSGIGGGICQLSNLIHWMAIHSPLVVVERSNHSFDPFPDEGWVLPFGSGAAIFYNYVDLVLHNPTDRHFQLKLNVAEQQLEGELFCGQAREFRFTFINLGIGLCETVGGFFGRTRYGGRSGARGRRVRC